MKRKLLAITLLGLLSATVNVQAADDDSGWIFRGTVAYVDPNDDSGEVLGNDGVSVDTGLGLGLSFTYMLDQHWGVEILAATPFTHDIVGTGALSGLAIGDTKQLPPTVSVTYSWGENTSFHVGAGLNYTKFFDEQSTSALTDALGATTTSLQLDASTGLSVQFGFDTPVSDDWNITGGVYYKDIDTTADVIVDGVRAASVNVQIDPIVWTIGVSTRL